MSIMAIVGIRYFNFAGPTDHVTFYRGGSEVASGKGLAGFLRPSTSVSVVPLGIKTISYQTTERSKDQQQIAVSGEVVVENVPEMRDYFDFSVYPSNGQFRNDPTAQIEDQVRIAIRKPIRAMLSEMTMDEIASEGTVKLEKMLSDAVADPKSELMKQLSANQIAVQSGSVKSVTPADMDLSEAIGAENREQMLKIQDDAVADRRQGAAEKDREIRAYEEETKLKLVKARAKRIKQEGTNQIASADAESKATAKRLEPFAKMEPGTVLAHALMLAANTGIDRVSIDPALIAAVRGSVE